MPFLLVVALIGMAARQGFRPIGDPDTWWHLRLGDDLWRSWNFTDPAPWTRFATEPWVTTQWLPEVIASRVEHAFGLPGVVWLLCAGLVLLAAVLYLTCRGEADVLAATIATLVAFLSADYIRDYLNTSQVRAGWQHLLDRTRPRYAPLRAGSPLTVALRERLHWTTVGMDADYVLLKAP